MNALKPRVKQWLKIAGIVLVLAVVFVAWILLRPTRKKKTVDANLTDKLDTAIETLRAEVTAANNEAAIAINAAQREDAALKTNLAEVVQIKDGARRRQRLIELREGIQ